MTDFWSELEGEVLDCLAARASASPADIARRLSLSEDAVVSILAMLAREGRVRIRLVEVIEQRALAA
jgi:DNA-binding CsgD family transcriptional regulator